MWCAQCGCRSELSDLDQDAAIEDQDHSAREERQARVGELRSGSGAPSAVTAHLCALR